ncbi:MAG TPA: tetratricopeptide repeat protein [Phycisphaerales bacterium]|nr:tetratricopeptide repeat protein [Phycisphaerales bacterium]
MLFDSFDSTESSPYDGAEQKARRARELYEDGDLHQALDELEAAIEVNPSNSAWHFNRGLTLDAVNRFDKAIESYEAALELNPSDVEVLNCLAVDYTRTGQYDRALEVFEQIEQTEPTFEPCYCNRIITYAEMGKHEAAEQMFYMAQQIDPDCALCYYNIGNSLFARRQYKKAIHCWRKTAELESTHPQINYRIAQAYWADGNTTEAREYFLRELRLSPGDVEVILDFGLFLLELGDLEAAKEKFNRILELRPEHVQAVFYLGEIAFQNGHYGRAQGLYTEALAKDGGGRESAGANYRLGQCALIAGDTRQARTYLLAELRRNPEDSYVLTSLGSMFLAIGDIEHAADCLLRAADKDWSNAEAYYYLGLVGAIRGDLEDACEFFGHALDIDAGHAEALRDSARVYLAMGRFDEAAERIAKAEAAAGPNREITALRRKIRRARQAAKIAELVETTTEKIVSCLPGKGAR